MLLFDVAYGPGKTVCLNNPGVSTLRVATIVNETGEEVHAFTGIASRGTSTHTLVCID